MGRPKGTKNTMRIPEEKERIILEALELGAAKASRAHGVDRRLLRRWVVKYQANGVGGIFHRHLAIVDLLADFDLFFLGH